MNEANTETGPQPGQLVDDPKFARSIFQILIVGCAFCWLAVMQTEEKDLVLNSARFKLPIIDAQVSLVAFFLLAPALLLVNFVYLHFYLQRSWRQLASTTEKVITGKADLGLLWIPLTAVKIFVKPDSPAVWERSEAYLAAALVWWSVPLTIAAIWFGFLPRHQLGISLIHAFLLSTSVGFAFVAIGQARRAFFGDGENESNWKGPTCALTILVVTAATSLGASLGTLDTFNVDLTEARLSMRPAVWTGERDRIAEELANVRDVADLRGANLRQAELSKSFLAKADLRRARLDNAKLWEAELSGADLEKTILIEAKLFSANLYATNLHQAIGARADLSSAQLERATLSNSDFSDVSAKFANFSDANLFGAILARADLESANLSKVRAMGADFSGANLTEADLTDTWLFDADFSNANLSGAKINRAILKRANFEGANLTDADLSGANLDGANLIGADLSNANVDRASFRQAALAGANIGAQNLTSRQLSQACLVLPPPFALFESATSFEFLPLYEQTCQPWESAFLNDLRQFVEEIEIQLDSETTENLETDALALYWATEVQAPDPRDSKIAWDLLTRVSRTRSKLALKEFHSIIEDRESRDKRALSRVGPLRNR